MAVHTLNTTWTRVEDPALARQLGAHQLLRESDLRMTLKWMYRVDARLKREEASTGRSKVREAREQRDRPFVPPMGTKARPIAIDALKAATANTWDDSDGEGDDGGEVDYEPTTCGDCCTDSTTDDSQGDVYEVLVKAIAAIQGRDALHKQSNGAMGAHQQTSDPCTHCGGTVGHSGTATATAGVDSRAKHAEPRVTRRSIATNAVKGAARYTIEVTVNWRRSVTNSKLGTTPASMLASCPLRSRSG